MPSFSYGGKMQQFTAIMQNLGSVVGALGIVELIKFFVSRKDKKQERKEDKEENSMANTLRKEFSKGLDEREATGKERFDINSKQIKENAAKIDEVIEISSQLKDNILLLTENISQMQEYNTNVGDAMKGIIHDRIIHNVDSFIERGGITQEEVATLKSMYVPYKKLGGNGDVETAFDIAVKLPIIPKQDALTKDMEIRRNGHA